MSKKKHIFLVLGELGLNTPIPSRNALENLSLNRNGISGSPLTQPLPTKRRDRLARFGTLEDGYIEQPFKPIKSDGKGDNTRPLWRNGRV